MDLPAQLKQIDHFIIHLQNGESVELPVCRPIFHKWLGETVAFDYGNKPILDFKGKPYFAELIILNLLLERGWSGAWIETYGGTHFLRSMPNAWNLNSEHISIPDDKAELLEKIRKTAGTTACFDVFAWKNDEFLFCESKHAKKDRLTSAQIKFIEGALACGIPKDSLLIAEWETGEESVFSTKEKAI